MCMLDIVRVCFCVRHVMKQYFKLFILVEYERTSIMEAMKMDCVFAIHFRCDLKAKFAYG